MATIDLGRLGFVNKGTYNNSTTYEKNDLVQFTDGGILSTYLYIDSTAQSGQAPSSSGTAGSRWVYFAKGVADAIAGAGNNKVLVTDGSGSLSPLAIGAAGKALKVNSGANGFEFADAGGGLVQLKTVVYNTQESLAINNTDTNTGMTISITPTSASNKILLTGMINGGVTGGYGGFGWTVKRAGTDIGAPSSGGSNAQSRYHSTYGNQATFGDNGQAQAVPIHILDNPATTSAVTYTLVARGVGGTSNMTLNRIGSGTGHIHNSYFTAMEIDGGIIV